MTAIDSMKTRWDELIAMSPAEHIAEACELLAKHERYTNIGKVALDRAQVHVGIAAAKAVAATAINTAPRTVELRPAPTDVAWLTEDCCPTDEQIAEQAAAYEAQEAERAAAVARGEVSVADDPWGPF